MAEAGALEGEEAAAAYERGILISVAEEPVAIPE